LIVIEGMDNSGKSTLAEYLAPRLRLKIQESEGPPLSSEEINLRVEGYLSLKDTLFVRHPCVSNPIYDLARPPGHRGWIRQSFIDKFYGLKPTLIYCDPLRRGMDTHETKGHDTSVHLQQITSKYVTLLLAYQKWAIAHAHIIYRIGDDIGGVLWMLRD
jgi:hypothetical protein